MQMSVAGQIDIGDPRLMPADGRDMELEIRQAARLQLLPGPVFDQPRQQQEQHRDGQHARCERSRRADQQSLGEPSPHLSLDAAQKTRRVLCGQHRREPHRFHREGPVAKKNPVDDASRMESL
jgi:hypothetical protein